MTRNLVMGTLPAMVLAWAGSAVAGGWTTNYRAALAEAGKTGKVVMLDFTGSDWCIWCTRLKDEVFDTAEFKAWADKNVILVELDFPKDKKLDAGAK
jgi:thiol:disulfide interchange protein